MNTPAESTVTVSRDVPFHAVDGEQLLLDAYESTATSGPRPAVVLVRGGGFTVGDKGEFARHALDLAEAGYLVVEPQYRLAPAHTFPAALVDVKAAIEWCRGDERVDPQRVAAVGHSAGANLAVLAAATADDPALEPDQYPGESSELTAVVGYSGVYDLRLGDDPDGRRAGYLGGNPEERPDVADLASPVAQADMSMPPTLLLHGRDDTVVSPRQSEILAETLDPLSTVVHEQVPGGHGFPFDGAHYDAVYERTADFLGQHLTTPGESPGRGDDFSEGPEPPGGRSVDGPDFSPR